MTAAEPGRVQRPGQQRAEATRDLLYQAAAALFVEQGYENTTMAEIAQRARTSRRTAFNHFPSKSDIPMRWVRRMADLAIDVTGAPECDQATERIRGYFRFISEMVEAEPELSAQMLLGWTAAAGPIRYESQLLADLTPMLQEGQARGQIDAAADAATIARTLSDILMGASFRWVREGDDGPSLQELVEAGIDLVLRAIQSGRPQQPNHQLR
ncbi:TetR/AcrR family transcriptional regulator [Dactylosporangium sp. CA-092794]|uniref:TetR/AcrR family transcriptional regulator n=1 Tax=Dactylosporangium sp. CA-092794 TaxID=3239929 RepID=UPI003D8F6EFF